MEVSERHLSPDTWPASPAFSWACRNPREPGTRAACVRTCVCAAGPRAGVLLETCGVEGESRSLSRHVSFQPHSARARSAARSSLARTWAATWRPQLVEDGAAGPQVGGRLPTPSQECWPPPLAVDPAWEGPECQELTNRLMNFVYAPFG